MDSARDAGAVDRGRVLADRGLVSERVRILGLGFSQGAHTLCRWLAYGQSRIDRAVLWGETVPPDLDLTEHGSTLSAADLQLVAGDSDEVFRPEAVSANKKRLVGTYPVEAEWRSNRNIS